MMDLKEIAKLLGSIAGQIDELEESLKQGLLKRLEVDRLLFYNMPDAAKEDVSSLEEEIKKILGGDSIEEAIRNAFQLKGRRIVRMGGKKLAIIVTGGGLGEDRPVPLRLMEEMKIKGNVRKFDASSYPLATLQEVVEYDPDFVVFVSVKRGDEAGISLRHLEVIVPEDRMKAGDLLAPPLLGVNDPESLAKALVAITGEREIWAVTCMSPHVEGDEVSGVDEGCLEDLREELRKLLNKLGF